MPKHLPKIVIDLLRSVSGVHLSSALAREIEELPECSSQDSFVFVGAFSPTEAPQVIRVLEANRLRFELECDTTAGSVGINGGFWDRSTIHLYVPTDDLMGAQKAIDAWRLSVSGLPSDQSKL